MMLPLLKNKRSLYRHLRACYRKQGLVYTGHVRQQPSVMASVSEFGELCHGACLGLVTSSGLTCPRLRSRSRLCALPVLCLVILTVLVITDPWQSRMPDDLHSNTFLARGLLGSWTFWREESHKGSVTPLPVLRPNCQALFQGNQEEVETTREMLYKESWVVPSDHDIIKVSSNCQNFTSTYHYFTNHQKHQDFSIAYAILVHQNAYQVERLLHSIYTPYHSYCIHVSANAGPTFNKALKSMAKCFPNIIITASSEKSTRFGYNRVRAEMACMRDLLILSKNWKYVINLQGEDFPLKNNKEIIESLTSLGDQNYLELAPEQGMIVDVSTVKYLYGKQYYYVTRHFVEFLFNSADALLLLSKLQQSKSADKIFWVTVGNVYKKAPNKYQAWLRDLSSLTISKNSRFAQKATPCLSSDRSSKCLFRIDDLHFLGKQKALFAHKFDTEVDHIVMDCLEQKLHYNINPAKSKVNITHTSPIMKPRR